VSRCEKGKIENVPFWAVFAGEEVEMLNSVKKCVFGPFSKVGKFEMLNSDVEVRPHQK